ncbi:MAG: hypothetical protein C0467_24110 [Planctomycetaceae bacterium]|nr:hypothetical protein [Planctomycetaceae bacterium]
MTTQSRRFGKFVFSLSLGAVLSAGCSGEPRRIEPPSFQANAGSAAITEYDSNKDGKIGGDELWKSPALKSALALIDSNKDGAITGEEIDARIQQWRASRVGLMPVACKVLLNGKPVAKARITFEPEAFLGNILHAATGVTDEEGIANMSISPEHLSNPALTGVAPGFYKIVAEIENERHNAGPHTGCEIALDASWSGEGIVPVEFTKK